MRYEIRVEGVLDEYRSLARSLAFRSAPRYKRSRSRPYEGRGMALGGGSYGSGTDTPVPKGGRAPPFPTCGVCFIDGSSDVNGRQESSHALLRSAVGRTA
jgi:hypothetical protein